MRLPAILALLLAAASALAQTNVIVSSQRVFRVSYGWEAPTLNVDDTPVTDLAAFNLYIRPDTNWTAGRDIEAVVLATNAAPATGEVYSATVEYAIDLQSAWAAVTAVDFSGNESDWSVPLLFTNLSPRPPPFRVLSVGISSVTITNLLITEPPAP